MSESTTTPSQEAPLANDIATELDRIAEEDNLIQSLRRKLYANSMTRNLVIEAHQARLAMLRETEVQVTRQIEARKTVLHKKCIEMARRRLGVKAARDTSKKTPRFLAPRA
jgi:hypothetical protein